MIKTLLTILFTLNFTTNVFALDIGQCEVDITKSKKYIQNDFQAPYPKKVIFSCFYNCLSEVGLETMKGISTVNVSSISSDAKTVVCQGVQVKKTSWGYDFDGTLPFYSYDTRIKSIKRWAFQNISQDNSMEREKLENLRDLLTEIGVSYVSAGSTNSKFNYFLQAGKRLLEIAYELPHNTKQLDLELQKIITNNGKLDLVQNTKEALVYNNLIHQAHWRLPIFE